MVGANFDWTELFSKKYIVYMHLLLWLLVFSSFIVFDEYPEQFNGVQLFCFILQLTLHLIIPCYSQVYLVWPFFSAKKFLLGGILYILQIILLILLLPHILNGIGASFTLTDPVDWTQEKMIFPIVFFTLFATVFKIALDKLLLDKEQKESELRHLKAQLNPHFLFNTLNNLYGLSIDQSKNLPEMMLKLSDLLRYSLYDTHHTYVSLKKELNYIENYIELEKIRLDKKTLIQVEIEGNIEDQVISPLMLIAFVENAFKHFSYASEEKGIILINFNIQGQKLKMVVENSLDPFLNKEVKSSQYKGIGLKNAKQRLELLYYQKYTLMEIRQENSYNVKLNMDLS